MKNFAVHCSVIVVSVVLAACSSVKPTVAVPTSTNAPAGSPAPATGYPAPSPLPTLRGDEVPFHITRPITAGATTVSGTGPAKVPIILEDVTFMGGVLGQTTVGADGKFQVPVQPLVANDRVGIAIGDLTGTNFTPDQFFSPGYWGDGSMQVPNVGFFYDTALVVGQ